MDSPRKRRVDAKVCQQCGKEYEGGGYKFCSKECMLGTGTCKKCGKVFQRTFTGQRFCPDCFNKAEERVCPGCGTAFASKYGQAYCSGECYEKARAHVSKPCPVCGRGVPKGRAHCSEDCKARAHGVIHVCQQCGREFRGANKKEKPPKFCSKECQSKAQVRRADRVCLTCGRAFHPHGMSKGMFCSRECSGVSLRTTNSCPICGKWVPSGKTYCSEGCREIGRLGLTYESEHESVLKAFDALSETIGREEARSRECIVCGEMFRAWSDRALTCSEACRRRYGNMRHDSRLYRNGLPDWSVTLPRLFVRDGGRCRGCGMLMTLDGEGNEEDYPSIDHIIPLARGGLHEWGNVQLMCRKCNWEKSDSVEGGKGAAEGAWF